MTTVTGKRFWGVGRFKQTRKGCARVRHDHVGINNPGRATEERLRCMPACHARVGTRVPPPRSCASPGPHTCGSAQGVLCPAQLKFQGLSLPDALLEGSLEFHDLCAVRVLATRFQADTPQWYACLIYAASAEVHCQAHTQQHPNDASRTHTHTCSSSARSSS